MGNFLDSEIGKKSLQLLAESGLDMVFVTDPEAKIIYVNDRFETVTGYSREEALGENPRIMNSGYQSEFFYEEMWETILSGSRWRGSFCNRKKNGELFWTDAVIVPVFDDEEELVAFASAHQDVTESQRLSERLQATVNNSVTGIITIDGAGEIKNVNAAAAEIFNYHPGEVIGTPVETIFPDIEIRESIHEFNREGMAELLGSRKEKKGKKSDGTIFPAQVEFNDIQTSQRVQFVCMVVDISKEVEYRDKLKKANEELKQKNKYLQRLSVIDPLTGIPNRRRFEEKLNDEWERCQREEQPLGVVILDIDNFKQYNDSYGHPDGDKCLQKVAGVLRNQIKRSIDIVARYGGEEFAAILPDTDLAGSQKVAENIRRAVENSQIEHKASPVKQVVTVSLGVASAGPGDENDEWELVEKADKALYRAKQAGKNQVKTTAN